MGVGRRMKKQGMPMSLDELGIDRKRKHDKKEARPSKKRRTSDEDEPMKLVKLDRAMRHGREENVEKTQKKQKQRLVNPDAQITIPPVMASQANDDIEEEVDDVEEIALDDAEINEASLSSEELNELAQAELDEQEASELSPASDSVFDTDEEEQTKAIFSDDDSDALETLNAANIEGLSRKLDAEQAQVQADADAELEDDALQTNIAEESGLLDEETPINTLTPDLQLLRSRIIETIRVLGNFAKLADKSKSRAEYTDLLIKDMTLYYGYTPYLANKLASLFSPAEAFAFFEANETPRPIVLRTNTLRTNRRTLAQALINRGVVLEPVGKWSKVGLQVFEAPVPLGATPEYLAGHYILQAASSFLPVMALAPQPGERVLDMAAAPGGKTTHMSALMRNTGAIFANDANRQRAKGLIGNVHRLGCKNVIVCNFEAQKAFPKILGGFDRVLLDAPCSGTGVIGKDPSVKTSKTERDFLALPHMQKQLLLAAIDSVDHTSKTGGYIVYSTCSVTVEENEGVVQYILRKRPNVKIVDTGLGSFGSEGFTAYEGKTFDARMNLTRRYFPHRENVDGFFVCKLKKTGPIPKNAGQLNSNGVGGESASVNGSRSGASAASESDGGVDIEMDQDDNFGGFDDDADQKIIDKAEQKWLKARGLDPKAAEGKVRKTKAKQDESTASEASESIVTNDAPNKEGEKQKKSKHSKMADVKSNGGAANATRGSKHEKKSKAAV